MEGRLHASNAFVDLDELPGIFLYMVQTMIDGNSIQPCLEAGIPAKRRKLLKGLDEDFLGEIHRVFTIFYEAEAESEDRPLVACHQLVESCHVAGEVSGDNFLVLISFLCGLRGLGGNRHDGSRGLTHDLLKLLAEKPFCLSNLLEKRL